MNLLPREEKFFDLFNQHVQILCQASRLLVTGLNGGYRGMCDIEKEMETIERSADEVIHEIFRKLQSTFLTPFDPEDIQTLATAIEGPPHGNAAPSNILHGRAEGRSLLQIRPRASASNHQYRAQNLSMQQ